MSSESIKNTISLMVITLVAGLLLGIVYDITKDPIAREQQRAKEEAYKEVFADADTFEPIEMDKDMDQTLQKHNYNATIDEAMRVFDKSGDLAGYVVTVTEHEGYGGDIQFVMGVKLDGTVNGIAFLSIGETAGLGMRAKEDSFKDQFAGKQVESFVINKDGASEDNEIDALSGATITTSAVLDGVNAGLYYITILE